MKDMAAGVAQVKQRWAGPTCESALLTAPG